MLPIRFGITNIPTTRQVATMQVSIQEDYRHLVYVGKPQPHQVPISFVGMPETSTKNIQIKDLYETPGEFSVLENSYLTRFVQRTAEKVFDLTSRYALITDMVLPSEIGDPTPLFYKHVLPEGFSATPEILDQDMNPVGPNTYRLNLADSEIAVFHNLVPDIDPSSNRVRIYYIRYTTQSGTPVFGLLQSEPAYREATLYDWPLSNKKVYTVRDLGSKFRYRILNQGAGPFFLKLTHESQIKLKKPILARSTEPWYLRITDGEILSSFDGAWERYSLPEYHFQSFTPVEPIQYSGTQECKVLDTHLALAPFENFLVDEDHRIELLITDDTLNPKYGFTSGNNEPRRFWVDRFGRWKAQGTIIKFPLSSFSDANISFNKEQGVLHFPVEMLPTDRVFIRAYHEVRDFTYMGLNLNPLHNRQLLEGRAVLYALPDSGLDEFQTAIQHLILDIDDNIISWSDKRLGDPTLIGELEADEESTSFDKFKSLNPRVLILGIVSINREASVNDLTFIDVREKGGGLTEVVEANLPKLLDNLPELEWVASDSISGRSIPLLGSFLLKLPFSILEEAGGPFNKLDVEKIVSRHTSLGSYPIIKYYAETPNITRAFYSGDFTLLILSWTNVEHADSYRIYISGEKNTGYGYVDVDIANDGFLPDCSTTAIPLVGSMFPVLMQFTPQDKIFVYVAPLKNGFEWPASNVAMIDLTTHSNVINLLLSAEIGSTPNLSFALSAEIIGE
jgi:hypothetical protein